MFDMPSPLARFEAGLCTPSDPIAAIRDGQIGKDICIPTPTGPKRMIYADYIASGRPLRQVEEFVAEEVLPFYANSHTEDSYCGAVMTQLREAARGVIAAKCGAHSDAHAVIFSGSGATAALNQLVHLFGIREAVAAGQKVRVIVGPYEHHSNLLPWRESGAEVVEIGEAAAGGLDMAALESALFEAPELTIAAFSAASNVTGICADVAGITSLVKSYGAKMVWDYAGGGPYLSIAMRRGGEIDAIALSPHKFIGGPGASGVLIVRRDAVTAQKPSRPGGGTVTFVNAHQHDYHSRIEEREEGGTPNVIGDIRAALALIVKDVMGDARIAARNKTLTKRAFAVWGDVAGIEVLAPEQRDRLPFLSFVPRDPDGKRMDHRTFTRALSERFGIQARGGCACAGPYVHRLMQIEDETSATIRQDILAGDESHKPGFVRLNLSVLMEDETVDFILDAVTELVSEAA
ncbi:MAG: aminotransferase class V-fold PLP-dependent enzyme [Rhodobacteraceae bacterium]|nr:aminotransferase class V-fold PLP-dependent enzyme [Paracoccaceae bacterium]